MIYTELTLKALRLMLRAHEGQKDKSGLPYFLHPLHLAEQQGDELSVCVALLHDTVEDTCVTLEELRREFPAAVAENVALLTHREGTPYMEYIRALAPYPVARAVKLADLRHNSDLTRLEAAGMPIGPRELERLERYARAIRLLEAQ